MRTTARLGQGVRWPLVEKGDSPWLKAPLTGENVTTTSTGGHGPRGRPRGTHGGCRCTCGLVEGGVLVTW